MVTISIAYEGELHCSALHGPSGSSLCTDAPVDNHGRGETFSPTDLVATALGTCMATVMGILARRHEVSLDGLRISVDKHMISSPARRIAKLDVRMQIPPTVSARTDSALRQALEHAANTCPVRLSLLDAIEVPVAFDWQEEHPS